MEEDARKTPIFSSNAQAFLRKQLHKKKHMQHEIFNLPDTLE